MLVECSTYGLRDWIYKHGVLLLQRLWLYSKVLVTQERPKHVGNPLCMEANCFVIFILTVERAVDFFNGLHCFLFLCFEFLLYCLSLSTPAPCRWTV